MSILIKKDGKNYEVATLDAEELKTALMYFEGEQQHRILTGIHNNPGILTHNVSGSFYCNNVPDIAQKTNYRLSLNGLKLVCLKPNKKAIYGNSHHWYLCKLPSEVSE